MKKRLSVAARYISLMFILTFGVISIIGSGGGGGGGGGTAVINEDNIRDIAQGIIDSTLIGEGFLEENGDLQIPEGACEAGGTITTVGSIDPPEVDKTIIVTFNNCQEFLDGSLVITNGTTTVTIKAVSADFDVENPPYSLSVEILIDLSEEIDDLGLFATITGDMTITISEDDAGELRVKIEGDSLTTQWDGEVETLSDFLFETADNWITGDFSKDLNGTIDSTLLGGSVTFATTTLFTGNENDGSEPTAGVLHITNSIDNSQALLVAREDGTGLEIKVDADGDGDYEFEDFISYDNL
jgi:hypothetical protein